MESKGDAHERGNRAAGGRDSRGVPDGGHQESARINTYVAIIRGT